jgi:hypothetical protein
MPSKRENLEQLLDRNLSKTPDQARRESQSITSILQRFGGPVSEPEPSLSSLNPEDHDEETKSAVVIIGTPNVTTPNLGAPNFSTREIVISEVDSAQTGMPESGTPTITQSKIGQASVAMRSERDPKRISESRFPLVDPSRGWLALPNDVVDKVFPTLSLPEQAVLLRMYRLSRGYGSETCTIGYVTLGRLCNITRNTVKSAVKSLVASGWIECLEQGTGADHSTYRINLPAATVPKLGTPKYNTPKFGMRKSSIPDNRIPTEGTPESGMVKDESDRAIAGIPTVAGIPGDDPIKEKKSTKEITHTTQVVSVASRFNLEECRRYAEHLKATGQGITNPGGYATKIFRSGEADALIDVFLKPHTTIDITQCPDCTGSGFIYVDPSNHDRGVKHCKHENLKRSM